MGWRKCGGVRGFVMVEFLAAVAIVFVLLLALLYIVNPTGKGAESGNVPMFRAANASYAYSLLERYRIDALSYIERTSKLPGDGSPKRAENATRGMGNGKIEKDFGENVLFFEDLYNTGFIQSETVRIRGLMLDVYWTDLFVGDVRVGEGNYFKLRGMNIFEAIALDHKYDDGNNATGNVVYNVVDDDTADLYYKLRLFI